MVATFLEDWRSAGFWVVFLHPGGVVWSPAPDPQLIWAKISNFKDKKTIVRAKISDLKDKKTRRGQGRGGEGGGCGVIE